MYSITLVKPQMRFSYHQLVYVSPPAIHHIAFIDHILHTAVSLLVNLLKQASNFFLVLTCFQAGIA